jgi:hypothetical protein
VAERLAAALGEPDGIAAQHTPGWVRPGTQVKFDTDYFSPDTGRRGR